MRYALGDLAKKGGVYRITCLATGWVYYGSTKAFGTRAASHERMLRRGKHHATALQRAYDEHGPGAFVFGVLLVMSDDRLGSRVEVEHALIEPAWGAGCYNRRKRPTPDMTGKKHSAETLEKMRLAATGTKRPKTPEQIEKHRQAILGRRQAPRSAEYRERLSAALRGKKRAPRSSEWIENMRRACTGKRHTQETKEKCRLLHLGKKKSPEHVEKMRLARTGKKLSPEHVEKLRARLIGRKQSPETIAKRKATMAASGATERVRRWATGRKQSPETIAKRLATRAATEAKRTRPQKQMLLDGLT